MQYSKNKEDCKISKVNEGWQELHQSDVMAYTIEIFRMVVYFNAYMTVIK